jgi:hypothetical protein
VGELSDFWFLIFLFQSTPQMWKAARDPLTTP